MTTELTLGRRLTVAAATVLISALVLYLLIAKPFASEGTRLTAEFGQAGQGLGTSSPVKIRGMHVGRVAKIELVPNGRARITLKIDDGIRVPDTVVASLEPESVFGPKFINLLLGEHETSGPYLRDGARIDRTSDPRDLNDLLADANQTLAALDPKDVAVIVDALAQGLGGQGQRLRETVDNVDQIVKVAYDNRKNAREFLDDLARLASIQGAGDDIAALVADTNAVIDTAASGQDRLRGFATGTSDVSALVAHGFDKYGSGGLREGFRSGERAVDVIAAQLGVVGSSVRTIIRLIPVYQQVGWVPTANANKHMLGIKVVIPLNPCHILLGVCPQGETRGGR